MARKSRYNGSTQELFADSSHYTVAIYLRLSVEDGDSIESNSIGNQRKLCLAFLEKHSDLQFGKVYVDDGHTGMDYQRPGFQEMFADLKANRVNCVLTKDVSRLGRHYIMTSEYVERIFPEMQVRLICINDNYDSTDIQSDRESLLMPFKLMMNDTYVKDTARRIRSSIHAKMDSGDFLPASGSIPYGYQRYSPENTFEVDTETAPVVQHIFELRSQGISFNSIAKELNAEGIPSPGKIRYDRGLTNSEKFRNALWLRGMIRKITGDTVYLGDRTHGKMTRKRLGGEKKQQPKELWQIIPNAHQPIITKELFDKVQEVNRTELDRRAAFQKRHDPAEDFRKIFQDKVYCGDCGAKMTAGKIEARESTPVSVYFNCNQYRHSNHLRCCNHYIRQEQLMDKLKHFLDKQVEVAVDIERLIAAVHAMEKAPNSMQNRLASLHSQTANMDAKLERLLEDATMGVLDREEYLRIKASYLAEQSVLQQQEQQAYEAYEHMKAALRTSEVWLRKIQHYRKVPVVDRDIVDALVDRILVYENRDIHISLTYNDPYAQLMACLCHSEGGISRAG